MSKKRIFTVGFSLPGEDLEDIDFDSDQTLLDADIVLFQPSLGHCSFDYGQQWEGKLILSESEVVSFPLPPPQVAATEIVSADSVKIATAADS
jgi:hypothetical protein